MCISIHERYEIQVLLMHNFHLSYIKSWVVIASLHSYYYQYIINIFIIILDANILKLYFSMCEWPKSLFGIVRVGSGLISKIRFTLLSTCPELVMYELISSSSTCNNWSQCWNLRNNSKKKVFVLLVNFWKLLIQSNFF